MKVKDITAIVHQVIGEYMQKAGPLTFTDVEAADCQLPPEVWEKFANYVFDETMDGVLLKYHKIGTSKIPKRYEAIAQVLLDTESHSCSIPVNLAKALSKYGVSESRGTTLVSEAIEKEILVLCEEDEFPDSDFDLHSFLNNK